MSRSKKGSKSPGYDFWSKRPGSGGSGKIAKKITTSKERTARRKLERNAKKERNE